MAHGITWTTTVDAFLDERIRQDKERQNALDALTRLTLHHPELENDIDMSVARMALLR